VGSAPSRSFDLTVGSGSGRVIGWSIGVRYGGIAKPRDEVASAAPSVGRVTRIAANLTMLFREHPFLERFDRAAEAGFTGVEFFFPYRHDHDAIAQALGRNGLELVLFNLPVGDYEAGERGYVAQTGREAEFAGDLARGVASAERLKPYRVNTPSGPAPETDEARATLIANLRSAATALEAASTALVVEPISRTEVPGAYLGTTTATAELLAELDRPSAGIQYDVFHSVRAGEDVVEQLDAHLASVIRHIQISDVPGRHEPGSGAVDFDRFFQVVGDSDYAGWVSLEYHPAVETVTSLQWFRDRGLLG
jgi:hydroxypyruvate isomerase